MARFKVVNNVKIPFTAEEEKARDAEEAQEELNRQEYLKVKYKDDREKVYPAIGDQLDALYHAGVFPKEMADKIKEVKEAHPKPE